MKIIYAVRNREHNFENSVVLKQGTWCKMAPTPPPPATNDDIMTRLGSNADLRGLWAQFLQSQQQGPPANVSVPTNDTDERIEDGTSSLTQNDVSYYRNEWRQIVSLSNIVNVYWKIVGTVFCYESRWDNCWFVVKEDN